MSITNLRGNIFLTSAVYLRHCCLNSCPKSLLIEGIKSAGACTDSYVILEFYVGKQLNSYLGVLFAIVEKKISMVHRK